MGRRRLQGDRLGDQQGAARLVKGGPARRFGKNSIARRAAAILGINLLMPTFRAACAAFPTFALRHRCASRHERRSCRLERTIVAPAGLLGRSDAV